MRYDLSLMDVDGRRLRRRKRWLLFSLLPMLIVFCVALKLITPSISTHFLKSAYDGGGYEAANFWGQLSLFVNIFEPYIAYYNDGTVSLAQGEFATAEEKFDLALQARPPEERRCVVRVNLSLSIELRADTLAVPKKYDEAIVLYDRAKAVLYGDNCVNPVGGAGKSAEALESRKRIEDKQEKAVRERNDDRQADSGDAQSDDPQSQDDQPASQSQQQDLLKRQKDALRYRSNSKGKRRGEDTNNYDRTGEKNW